MNRGNIRMKPTLNWMLPFIVIAVYFEYYYAQRHNIIFLSSCLAIIPLAGLLSRATEALADHIGDTFGGILNATFGNATEFIICVVALKAGQVQIVKASLIGALIANILLVLGASLLAGGMTHSLQQFNVQGAKSQSIDFSIAAIALIIPAAFYSIGKEWVSDQTIGYLSLSISIILITVYLLSLLFALYTNQSFFTNPTTEVKVEKKAPAWSLKTSVMLLITSVAMIAWMSEIFVGSVTQAADAMGMSKAFVGVIIVALVGSAAEQSTAIMMAVKNRLNLSLAIAIGSGIQIALFVTPLLVILSYFLPISRMDLIFGRGEILVVVLASYLLSQVTSIGESTWYKGAQLLAVYIIIAIAFYLFK